MSDVGTILVVEDNPITRKMLRVVLQAEGYSVVEATDGREALAAVEEARPDLVLQDLILPDMDGVELLRRLRAVTGAELPVLALSGFLSRLEQLQTSEEGFTALLVKPIEPSRLVESVRIYLPRPRPTGTARGKGRRVLVVDDDPVQLKLTRLRFSQFGFETTTALGMSTAVAAARREHPDVILSDVFMPDGDGFQLCLELRRDPGLGDIPVVLISGHYGSPTDQDLAHRVGANALVARTPDFADAYAAVVDALEQGAPVGAEEPGAGVQLKHARLVISQLERQLAAMTGLAQQCSVQAAQLSLLSGVADALTREQNVDKTLRDVLAATLDAAGISKGALFTRDAGGRLRLRQDVGFSVAERARLETFFGHLEVLEQIVDETGSVAVPSGSIPAAVGGTILDGAGVASAQIVPLLSEGQGVGAMIIGATRTDVSTTDSVAFARAMGNQIVQSLELSRSVARLAASEERYRTLLEHANDAIAVITLDGVVREMNQRWMEITGLRHDQLVGRHIGQFVPAAKADQTVRLYNDAVAAGASRTPPIEIVRHDASIVLMEFATTTIAVGGERLLFSIGRDITEQRLLEDQLRQAQKLEGIGQLAGGVAHDFNNVLTAILGFSELLIGRFSPDDPLRRDLVEIRRAGERAAGLTRQLLAFSRKQILQPRVLEINALVSGIEPMLRRLIPEHVDMAMVLPPDAGRIKMDPSQLEQILVNLAVNAADAMPRGGKLTIETGHVLLDEQYRQRHLPVSPGRYAMLAVTDTGSGMDEATRTRIFEPFFTTKEPGKGTGLGLSTVHGIVKQSGGDIWVYSEPGRGTTFKIYLPQFTGDVPSRREKRSAAPVSLQGSETILLVEDDDAVRLLARVSLERAGYRIIEAGDPKEALRVAGAFDGPIELLVSDVIMPESEGAPLLDRLLPSRPRIRVLYISGYADEAIVRHGILTEGTPFLQKPFTPQALQRKVRETLDA